MGVDFAFSWEISLMHWCQTCVPGAILKGLSFLSYIGDSVPMVAIFGIIYLIIDKKLGRKLIMNTTISLLFAGGLKNVLLRRRPYFDHPEIQCLKPVYPEYDIYDPGKQGFSFPSMHASNITTASLTVYYYVKKNWALILALALPFIIGVSRFLVGVHYPTDVMVGWGLGFMVAFGINKIGEKGKEKTLYFWMAILGFIGCFFCKTIDYFSGYGILLGFIGCVLFDEKKVNFSNTNNIIRGILRVFLAMVAFLLLAEGPKLFIPEQIIEGDHGLAYLIRVIRYGLGCFAGFGLTPMIYKKNILKFKE